MPPRSLYPLHFQTIPKNVYFSSKESSQDGSSANWARRRFHFTDVRLSEEAFPKILQSESQLTLAHAVVIEYDQVTTCYPFGVIIEKSDVFDISPLKCARFQCIANDQQVSDRSQIWQQQQKLANSAQL